MPRPARVDRPAFGILFLTTVFLTVMMVGCDSSKVESRNIVQPKNTQEQQIDWPSFRGPDSLSQTDIKYPTEWGVDHGILWKSELPGRGASSPVLSGDHIYLTAYSGYGLTVENAGDVKDLRHHLLCIDRKNGEPIWQRKVTGTSIDQKMNPELERHGFASSTPVTDGEKVFAYFGVSGLFAFDRDGKPLWQRSLGLKTHYFGSSASPVLHNDLVIVNASIESDTIYALNKDTGAVVWMIPGIRACWSMPVIGTSAEGRTEMIVSSKNTLASFDPTTGEELWRCAGIQDYVVSVPIIVDGVCYLTGGKEKQTMAVRLGGSGDVESTHKIWEKKKIGANVSSPVYHDGRLYIFHDNGILQIINAEDGELIKRQRTATRTRPFSSPLLAGPFLYMPFQDAGIVIFDADENAAEAGVASLTDDLPWMGSIAAGGDGLFFRNDKYLYCVQGGATKTDIVAWKIPKDHQVVETFEVFNIDPVKKWERRYLGYMTDDTDRIKKILLMPYQSVITDEQTQESLTIIDGELDKYRAIHDRYKGVYQNYLKATAEESKAFNDQFAEIEKELNQLSGATRILVKKLFSDEQMEKHLADAKQGKAHLKPEESKSGDQDKD